MSEIATARSTAERHLAGEMPGRWLHVSAVAINAADVAGVLGLDVDLLVASAWLHDIGYSEPLVKSGFHPLDGGRFLRAEGFNDQICRLVAHHSCAVVEAQLRGLDRELQLEFPFPDPALSDALLYCDMVTGPLGERVSVKDRLDEIRMRYGPENVVSRFVNLAEQDLVAAVRRTRERLDLAQLPS